MVIFVSTDPDGYVTGWSCSRMSEHEIEYDAPQEFIERPFTYQYVNGSFEKCPDKTRILDARPDNKGYLKFLQDTDWKIIRHRDQLELGLETSLTNEEYIGLLRDRQEFREMIVNK